MDKIFERVIENGIGLIGTARLDCVLPERLKHLPYAVSLVFPLLDAVVDEIDGKPTFAYFHHYRTVNTFLDQQTLYISSQISRRGYRAMPVAASQSVKDGADKYTGIFQHKTAAVQAGLGWIGKSGLLVTPEYGPRVRLATVLTDMPLESGCERLADGCGDCKICANACPAMAITGENYVPGALRSTIFDAQSCSEYMKRSFQHIGRGAVCGICMKVCPYGHKKSSHD